MFIVPTGPGAGLAGGGTTPLIATGARLASVSPVPPSLIEFPADDPERARRFWSGVLNIELGARPADEGQGWQTHGGATNVGVHVRGVGPGDLFSLPYFTVDDMPAALERVAALGGALVHPGERWSVCRDSEGSPFGLALATPES